jgi:hypothetical protein
MTTSVYLINKGINKPIIFHDLRAQYILYAGAIITGDMLLFAILYISGISSWICLPFTMTIGTASLPPQPSIWRIWPPKKRAARRFPKTIRSHSRHTFINLKNSA